MMMSKHSIDEDFLTYGGSTSPEQSLFKMIETENNMSHRDSIHGEGLDRNKEAEIKPLGVDLSGLYTIKYQDFNSNPPNLSGADPVDKFMMKK